MLGRKRCRVGEHHLAARPLDNVQPARRITRVAERGGGGAGFGVHGRRGLRVRRTKGKPVVTRATSGSAWQVANGGDLLDTYRRLKAKGIVPYWPIHHGFTVSLYYRDPDGNRMEFQVDTCTAAEAKRSCKPTCSPRTLLA